MRSFQKFIVVCSSFAFIACGSTAKTDGTVSADDTSSGDTSADGGDTSMGSDVSSGDSSGSDTSSGAVISGTYASNFGGYEIISETTWNEMSISKIDLSARFGITKNSPTDKYNPAKFNKIVWTAPASGSFYYCLVDYGLASADLAEKTSKSADASTPDKSGCGGFSWTKLTSTDAIAIAGKYNDNFGGKSVISSRYWDTAWMQKYDNAKRVAITQNSADDKYNPSKFSKVVWTAPTAGSFYTCMVDYGLDSADLAENSTKTADDSAPDKSGCGGFSWTKMTPQ